MQSCINNKGQTAHNKYNENTIATTKNTIKTAIK
jgi:hypothetical protein